MCSEGKLIFSKRFPRLDADEMRAQAAEDPLESAPPPSFDKFLREVRENSVYVPIPDKIARRQRFIDLAKQLCLDYEIDTEIKEYGHFISVNLHLYCGAYTGTLKRMLSELVSMCDRVCSFRPKTGPYDLTLSLDYYTHDHYISGRKVN